MKYERYGKCFPNPNDDYYFNETANAYIKCLNSTNFERCLRCNFTTCFECDTKAPMLKDGKCIRIND